MTPAVLLRKTKLQGLIRPAAYVRRRSVSRGLINKPRLFAEKYVILFSRKGRPARGCERPAMTINERITYGSM